MFSPSTREAITDGCSDQRKHVSSLRGAAQLVIAQTAEFGAHRIDPLNIGPVAARRRKHRFQKTHSSSSSFKSRLWLLGTKGRWRGALKQGSIQEDNRDGRIIGRNRKRGVRSIGETGFAGLANLSLRPLGSVDPNDTGLNAGDGEMDGWSTETRHDQQEHRREPGSNPQSHLGRVCHNSPDGRYHLFMFPGFSGEALTFLRGLARNNNREWFQPRKEIFETKIKAPMLALWKL